jgi:hypothetical protein
VEELTRQRSDLDRRIATGNVPASLRDVLMPFPWDLGRLLALDLPVETIEVSDHLWLLDLPLWREHGRWFAVTPNEVRRRPSDHRKQWERTLAADLASPVHVTRRTPERVVILDGVHRLLRCVVEGGSELPARILPQDRWSEIEVRDDAAASR